MYALLNRSEDRRFLIGFPKYEKYSKKYKNNMKIHVAELERE